MSYPAQILRFLHKDHPYRRYRTRGFIADRSLPFLILLFVVLIGILGLFLSLPYFFSDSPLSLQTFFQTWKDTSLALLGRDFPNSGPSLEWLTETNEILLAVLRVLLPALVFGAVLYKIFLLPSAFQFRKYASVMWSNDGWVLVSRLYNTTNMTAVDITFEAYLRAPMPGRENQIIVTNRPLTPTKKSWSVSQPTVPYTLKLNLEDGDVEMSETGEWRLSRIRGIPLPAKWRIAIIVRGTIPSLSTQVTQIHWIKAKQLVFGGFSDIEVNYDTIAESSRWRGWQEFEVVPDDPDINFVFGYGSLVRKISPPPGRDLNPRGFVADLPGYRRTWGVAMDNSKNLPGYKFYVDAATGERLDGFVAFLDVVYDPESSLNGVCIPVTTAELLQLDRRERNYDRQDVSELFPDAPGKVWVYVGTTEARARCAKGREASSLFVQSSYREDVEESFRELGESEIEQFRATTEPLEGLQEVALLRRQLPPA